MFAPSDFPPSTPSVPLSEPTRPSTAPVNACERLPRHHVLNLESQKLALRGQRQHPPTPILTCGAWCQVLPFASKGKT